MWSNDSFASEDVGRSKEEATEVIALSSWHLSHLNCMPSNVNQHNGSKSQKKCTTLQQGENTLDDQQDEWLQQLINSSFSRSENSKLSRHTTRVPRTVRYATRRRCYRDVNIHYKNFYNAFDETLYANRFVATRQYPSNEDWIAQRKIRKRQQCMFPFEIKPDVAQAENDAQWAHYNETLLEFIGQRLDPCVNLLEEQGHCEMSQQLMGLQRHTSGSRGKQRQRNSPRRLPVTSTAQRERLSHLMSKTIRALKSPFVAMSSTFSSNEQTSPSIEGGVAGYDCPAIEACSNVEGVVREIVFRDIQGLFEQSFDRTPSEEVVSRDFDAEESPSVAQWSTGTAIETDWDDSSSSSSSG